MVDANFLAGIGAASAVFLSSLGTALPSVNAGVYAVRSNHQSMLFSLIPIIISGVLSIYGLIVAVLLSSRMNSNKELSMASGYQLLSAGLSVGCACLASGIGMAGFLKHSITTSSTMGTTGTTTSEESKSLIADSSRANLLPHPTPITPVTPISPKFLMVLCFLEAVGLYGLIVALLMIGNE